MCKEYIFYKFCLHSTMNISMTREIPKFCCLWIILLITFEFLLLVISNFSCLLINHKLLVDNFNNSHKVKKKRENGSELN